MSHRSWVQAPQGVLDLHPYKVLHCCWWTSHSLHYLFHFQATKIWCTLYVGCISWYLRNCCIAHGGHFGNAYKGALVDCFHIARILDVCQFGPLLCCFSVLAIVGPGWVGLVFGCDFKSRGMETYRGSIPPPWRCSDFHKSAIVRQFVPVIWNWAVDVSTKIHHCQSGKIRVMCIFRSIFSLLGPKICKKS